MRSRRPASRLDNGSSKSSRRGSVTTAPGHGHALLLATRKFGAEALAIAIKTHKPQHLGDPGRHVGAARATRPQPIGDIVEHGHVWPHGVGLEHHVHAALLGRHFPPAASYDILPDADLARGRTLQPGNAAQCRCLAAARRAKQRHELSFRHGEGNGVHGPHVAVLHNEVADREIAHAYTCFESLTRNT